MYTVDCTVHISYVSRLCPGNVDLGWFMFNLGSCMLGGMPMFLYKDLGFGLGDGSSIRS